MKRISKDETRELLIDAAIDGIAEYGWDDVQITQIAARAGVSSRTLHRYYAEKETLFTDAAVKYVGGMYKGCAEQYGALDKTGKTGLERILLLLSFQREYCRRAAVVAALFVDIRMYQTDYGAENHPGIVEGGARIKDIVMENIALGVEDGSIRADVDATRAFAVISAGFNGIMQRLSTRRISTVPQEELQGYKDGVFEEYAEMLTRYLRK